MRFFEKEVNGAIFDMDGTMFDTERLRMLTLIKASKKLYKKGFTDKFLIECLGISAVSAEKMAKEAYGEDFPYKEIRALADKYEREHIRKNGVPVKDGLYNLLERLKKAGVFIALATSSRREIAEEYLITAKVHRYFDIIVCGDDIENGKPNPEIFLKAASELAIPPEKCLIFEDSENGLKAASAAGGIPVYIQDIIDLHTKTKGLYYKNYSSMAFLVKDIEKVTLKLSPPQLNESYPLNHDNIVLGIHGFGAIGGGYLAPIFLHYDGYTRPKEIIGAARNPFIISLVNSVKTYRIKYESEAYFQYVDGVKLIDIDNCEAVNAMYEQSEIIGISLPEQAIPKQAGAIAQGLINRYRAGKDDLTLLIVMNRVGASDFVKKHVFSALKTFADKDEAQKVLNRTVFAETVVNRMVTALSDDFIVKKLKHNLRTAALKFRNIKTELDNLSDFYGRFDGGEKNGNDAKISVSGSLSTIINLSKVADELNITLFSSEADIPLYVSKDCGAAAKLRQTVAIDDITAMQEIKNKLSNGTHAAIAWYSLLLGYKTIGQGMGDKRVRSLAENILKSTLRPILTLQNPQYSSYIKKFSDSFLSRCRKSFKDGCKRVGRDVMRKLQKGERIFGAIELSNAYEYNTDSLETAAAAALLCCEKEILTDSEAAKIKQLLHIGGVNAALTYNGKYLRGKYNGLDRKKDAPLISRIEDKFNLLNALTK